MPLVRRLLVALILTTMAGIAYASTPKLSDYPLRVQIFKEHSGSRGLYEWGAFFPDGYHGYGDANVMDGNKINGMKFTFECSDHFITTDNDEAYPARWRKPYQEIELIAQMVGSNSVHKCIMKTTLKDDIYYRLNGKLIVLTQDAYKQRLANHAEKEASLAPKDVNPSDYNLQLTILNINWGGRHAGIYTGQGQGNLVMDGTMHAVDFNAHCISRLVVNPIGRYYRTKWTQPGSQDRMLLLLHHVGDNAAATCDLYPRLHNDVYIRRSTGDLQAVTPAEYKNFEHAAVLSPSN